MDFRGEKILFTDERIKDKDKHPSLNFYSIRHDDDGYGDPCTIEEGVWVNHFGDIVCNHKLDLDNTGYNGTHWIDLSEFEKSDFYGYQHSLTIEEYTNLTFETRFVEVIIGNRKVKIKDEEFEVDIFTRDMPYTDYRFKHAYIFNNLLLPYRGELSSWIGKIFEAGLYQHNEKLLMVLPPENEKDIYHIRNIRRKEG